MQQVYSAQSENRLLAQAVKRIATVEVVRQMTIPGVVPFDIGV